MPTKHIPTIVGAGVTLAVTDAVLGRRARAKGRTTRKEVSMPTKKRKATKKRKSTKRKSKC